MAISLASLAVYPEALLVASLLFARKGLLVPCPAEMPLKPPLCVTDSVLVLLPRSVPQPLYCELR